MIISEKKIEEIRQEFKSRFNALIFKIAGPENLTKEEIQELINRGYIDPNDPNHGLITDAYHIARVRSGTAFDQRPDIPLHEFRDNLKDLLPPLTAREQYAIKHIKRSAGNYLKNLQAKAVTSIEGTIRGFNYDERNRLLTEVVRPTLDQGVQEAKATIGEIASRLRERTGDLYRDWRRVAITEMSNALNLGAADAIIDRNTEKSADQVYVYKIVHHDAATCPHCKRFYLEPDEMTPKVYSMSELMGNGSNMGKKTKEWLPTIGATHPHERCELVELPDGWGFEPGSNQARYMGRDFVWARDRNKSVE